MSKKKTEIDVRQTVYAIFVRVHRGFLWVFSRISPILSICALSLAIATSLLLIAFSYCHISLLIGKTPEGIFRTAADKVLYLLLGAEVPAPIYGAAINAALNGVIVLVAIWFAGASVANSWAFRRRFRQEQCFQKVEILQDGVDDVVEMEKRFHKADAAIVFAGDFSWIKDFESFRKKLIDIKNRVTLVSSKSESAVEAALGKEIFVELKARFIFESGINIKCSFIQHLGHRVFLYKSYSDHSRPTICRIEERPDSRYLLDVIGILCQHRVDAAK